MKKPFCLSCRCGAVEIRVAPEGVRSGTRLRCYCKDCRAAARHFGAEIAANGGVDIFQTTPDRLGIEKGAEHLAIMRLSPRGLMRWHSTCCGTPLLNTLPRPGLPFSGLVIPPRLEQQADQTLGPVFGHAHTAQAPRGVGAPARDVRFGAAGLKVLQRMLAAFLSGRHRINPLRGDDGQWQAPVHVISRQERAAASD